MYCMQCKALGVTEKDMKASKHNDVEYFKGAVT